ncbi:hypothetical protein P280DRAFT_469014 [Massarina eburnea CBS 473.64]|uniref:Uncharacterized protein n=1 Tax=Massarina eburnea CBS 473.64 TaxID=1395130 RepID=A0A6A6S1E3_9PLEO|nr:hypothetical protein P280DRAFT_469014 [Massarina eburnea CBS 473.64]
MPSLPDLPREIRDEIVRLAVLEWAEQPSNTSNTRRYRRKDVGEYPRLADFRDCVYQPENSPTIPLLQVNKQFRAEAFDAIAHHRLVSRIDLAFIDWTWLWPTWRIVLPRTTPVIDRLDVNVILAVSEDDYEHRRSTQTQTWRTCATLWGFISRLLGVGPVGSMDTGRPDQNIRIRELRIDIVTEFMDRGPWGQTQPMPEDKIPNRVMDGLAHLDHKQLFTVDESSATQYFDQLLAHLDDHCRDMVERAPGTQTYIQILERIGRIAFTLNSKSRILHPVLVKDCIHGTWPDPSLPKVEAYYIEKRQIRRRNGLDQEPVQDSDSEAASNYYVW